MITDLPPSLLRTGTRVVCRTLTSVHCMWGKNDCCEKSQWKALTLLSSLDKAVQKTRILLPGSVGRDAGSLQRPKGCHRPT